MVLRIAALMAGLLLAGCAISGPVEVAVPVMQRPTPPAGLLIPIPSPGPIWIAPDAPSALACLAQPGVDALVGHVDLLRQRVGAWAVWAGP